MDSGKFQGDGHAFRVAQPLWLLPSYCPGSQVFSHQWSEVAFDAPLSLFFRLISESSLGVSFSITFILRNRIIDFCLKMIHFRCIYYMSQTEKLFLVIWCVLRPQQEAVFRGTQVCLTLHFIWIKANSRWAQPTLDPSQLRSWYVNLYAYVFTISCLFAHFFCCSRLSVVDLSKFFFMFLTHHKSDPSSRKQFLCKYPNRLYSAFLVNPK